MLEKPDLIDADALGQLDLFELAPNISTCVEFSRGVVVDQMASLTVLSFLGSSDNAPRPAAPWFWARRVPSIALPARPLGRGVSASMKGEDAAPVEGNLTRDSVYWGMQQTLPGFLHETACSISRRRL